MSIHAGGVLFPALVMVHLLWDWKHGGFRGIVPQIFGALCLGALLNAFVNPYHFTLNKIETGMTIYTILAGLFYWWAWARRHPKPRQ